MKCLRIPIEVCWGSYQPFQPVQKEGIMDSYFDQVIDRGTKSGSYSSKWQDVEDNFRDYAMDHPVPMWVADMDFLCPPQVIEAVKKRAEHGIFGYASNQSVEDFKEAAVEWFLHRHHWKIQKDWMIFIPAVVPAICAAIQEFTNSGDEVLIQPPVYYPFMRSIRNNGRIILENPLRETGDSYEMDFDHLEAVLKQRHPKLMILCSPHNPVGRVWRREELSKLRSLCCQYKVILFSDEIHCDLIFPPAQHCPVGTLDEEWGTKYLVAISPSKTFNIAGLQASLLVVPDDSLRRRIYRRTVANRLPYSNIFGPIAGQAAYRYGDKYADQLVQYIQGNFLYADSTFRQQAKGVNLFRTEGTYLAWADLRETGLDAGTVHRKILEEAQIAVDIGKWFGTGGDGFIRLNFACPRSTVKEAVKRICDVLPK